MKLTQPRRTELTTAQREAMEYARRLLAPHFPGETLRLYVPQQAIDQKLQREARIREQLQAGQKPLEVARREGVSRTYVYALRGRFK